MSHLITLLDSKILVVLLVLFAPARTHSLSAITLALILDAPFEALFVLSILVPPAFVIGAMAALFSRRTNVRETCKWVRTKKARKELIWRINTC